MTRAILAPLLFAILAAAAVPVPAAGEEIRLTADPLLSGDLGFRFRSWKIEKEGSPVVDVTEWTVPMNFRKPIGTAADLSLSLSTYSAVLEGEEKSTAGGVGDALLSATYRFDEGRLLAGLILGLPTGKSEVDDDEESVVGVVANRILGFPMKRFGEGFDVGARIVRGFSPSRGVALSAGAGYLLKGEYPFRRNGSSSVDYRPGDEIFAAAGAEWEGRRGGTVFRLAGDLRYRMFGKDRRNGEDFYEEGDQIDILLDGSVRFSGGGMLAARSFLVFKGDGSEEGVFGNVSLDSLSLERFLLRSMTGDYREFALGYTHPVTPRADLSGRAALLDFGDYSFGGDAGDAGVERLLGAARVWEIGGGAGFRFSPRFDLSMYVAWMTGDAEEGAVDLTGFDLLTAFRWIY